MNHAAIRNFTALKIVEKTSEAGDYGEQKMLAFYEERILFLTST